MASDTGPVLLDSQHIAPCNGIASLVDIGFGPSHVVDFAGHAVGNGCGRSFLYGVELSRSNLGFKTAMTGNGLSVAV
jgi:hypothetical protein